MAAKRPRGKIKYIKKIQGDAGREYNKIQDSFEETAGDDDELGRRVTRKNKIGGAQKDC